MSEAKKGMKRDRERMIKGQHLLQFPFLIIALVGYLAAGLFMDLWHPTWVVFPLAALYYYVALQWAYPTWRKAIQVVFPIMTTGFVYLGIGLVYEIWHPTWLVFVIAAGWIWMVESKKLFADWS